MGYTHNFGILTVPTEEEINKIIPIEKDIIKRYKNILCRTRVDKEEVTFDTNSEDKTIDHEPFLVPFDGEMYVGFCRTGRMDYDIVACESLIVLAWAMPNFRFGSNGFITNVRKIEKDNVKECVDKTWLKAIDNVKEHYDIDCFIGFSSIDGGEFVEFAVEINGRNAWIRNVSEDIFITATKQPRRRRVYANDLNTFADCAISE
jgi:hypothetical protein